MDIKTSPTVACSKYIGLFRKIIGLLCEYTGLICALFSFLCTFLVFFCIYAPCAYEMDIETNKLTKETYVFAEFTKETYVFWHAPCAYELDIKTNEFTKETYVFAEFTKETSANTCVSYVLRMHPQETLVYILRSVKKTISCALCTFWGPYKSQIHVSLVHSEVCIKDIYTCLVCILKSVQRLNICVSCTFWGLHKRQIHVSLAC